MSVLRIGVLWSWEAVDFDTLTGKVFTLVRRVTTTEGNDGILFGNDEEAYVLAHMQDCCEYVYIESIDGPVTISELQGQMILEARESTSDPTGQQDTSVKPEDDDGYSSDSFTWTFYTIRTQRDTWTIRFYGSSNGYYGETADLYRAPKNFFYLHVDDEDATVS